jgi:predicted dehydrogenase
MMQVAMIGCGFIADLYLRSIRNYPSLRLIGVTDRDIKRAHHFGSFYDVPVYGSVDQLLSDHKVQIVLNLTNPRSHYAVSKACLHAGKHVYSEKPLATDFTEAKELVNLAEARGLRISSAPCSLLGECAQTMWKAVRENRIGRIRAAYAEMDGGLVHRMPYRKWLSASGTPWPYKDEFEVGCTIEHAGYSLSWLAAFFGSAQSVTAFSSIQIPDKHPSISPDKIAPDFSVAAIQFSSGIVARLTCSLIAPQDHALRIMGDDGILYTSDVWNYRSRVYVRRWITVRRRTFLGPWRTRYRRLAESGRDLLPDDRGRGVAELAEAIAEGRQSRLSAQFSLHVTELSLAIQRAGFEAKAYRMTTCFDPIAPMLWAR